MTGTDGAVVEARDVDHSFATVDVLADVSLGVDRGELTVLVGPNGSGKTTLARILAGLLAPSSGEVVLHADVERPVGYLPQRPRFRPAFTVEETLTFYADLLGGDADVTDAMERTGLLDVRDRRLDALSGGMRRLLGLAQSFLGRPPFVVLDEPGSGLDPRMTRQFFEAAAREADAGTAVFLVTHDLDHAARADRVCVLDRGRLTATGAPDVLCSETDTDTLLDAFYALVGTEPTVQAGQATGEAADD